MEIKRKGGDKSRRHGSQLHVGSNARSLPFRIGGGVSAVPRERGECTYPFGGRVGVVGGDEVLLPDAASVRRNSTQRREKDWMTLQPLLLAQELCRVPLSRLSSRAPTDAAVLAN